LKEREGVRTDILSFYMQLCSLRSPLFLKRVVGVSFYRGKRELQSFFMILHTFMFFTPPSLFKERGRGEFLQERERTTRLFYHFTNI
jgi:hypothetical protein